MKFDKFIENLVFERSRLNSRVFKKLFISYSCILFIILCALKSFCIKMLCFFFFKTGISRFSIDRTYCSTDRNCDKNFDLTNFFHASFLFMIHILCIVFFCIHLAVLQSYLSLFWHITCIHFAKLGTQLDLKIDWLIFESFVHSSICYFYVWTVENYFLKRYNG